MTAPHQEERPDKRAGSCGAEDVTNQEDAAQVKTAETACYGSAEDRRRKHLARLQAATAMAGGTLVGSHNEGGQPSYLLTRWVYTREFTDLAEVERVLVAMGVPT